MAQLHAFAGNVALPLDGRLGFGQPGVEGDEPTGPQIMVVDGDPSGVVTAPAGTLALDPTTPALWQNTDGATAWAAAGGSAGAWQTSQVRIQLSDFPSDVGYLAFFPELPAGAGAVGTALYVTEAAAGGGVTTCTANGGNANLIKMIDQEQLVGASLGFRRPNGLGEVFIDGQTIAFPEGPVALGIGADVNLDTLTNFDVTFYLFYVVPQGMTIP